jgi:Secretion system C-terminal sorting domain
MRTTNCIYEIDQLFPLLRRGSKAKVKKNSLFYNCNWRQFLFLLFFPCSLMGQSTYFEKVYGTAGIDVSRSVKQMSSGSIYVLGNSDAGIYGATDISLTKLDKYGTVLWTQYYGTPNVENGFYLNTTADGNFVLAGESETAVNNLDVFIYKVDTAGTIIWNTIYATSINETAKYIEQTTDGGYVVAGSQNDASGFYDMLVIKLDAAGTEEWHQTYGRADNDIADMVHQKTGGGYILTGDTKSYGAGGTDVMLFNLDAVGNEIWSQPYGDSLQNGCQGVYKTSDGNYLSYGETEISPFSPFNFYLEKIDTNGVSLWRYTYGGTGTDAIFSVVEDSDGGFVCTGYSNSYNGGAPIDLAILKVDQLGSFLWEQTYGGAGIDIGYEIIRSVDGNGFIIVGKTVATTDEYYLLKLDNNGVVSGITINEKNNSTLSNAFPNPANNQTTIAYKINASSTNTKIILTDVFGKMLQTYSLTSNAGSLFIPTINYDEGIYFYSLIADGKIMSTKKLTIIH